MLFKNIVYFQDNQTQSSYVLGSLSVEELFNM